MLQTSRHMGAGRDLILIHRALKNPGVLACAYSSSVGEVKVGRVPVACLPATLTHTVSFRPVRPPTQKK